jgi:hypothetical protein
VGQVVMEKLHRHLERTALPQQAVAAEQKQRLLGLVAMGVVL